MKRLGIVGMMFVLMSWWGMAHVPDTSPSDNPAAAEISNESDLALAQLSDKAGVLIKRSWLQPQVAYAVQADCSIPCNLGHAWGSTGAWSVFRTIPKYAYDSRSLVWQEHASGNIPPVSIFVSWGGSVENLEISPAGASSGSGATSGNIIFHTAIVSGCDGASGSSQQNLAPQGRPCIASVDYDIDWDEVVNGDQWDWIYFWVRDPDFVAMKGVDASSCSTTQWPYEYVNDGPVYSICQDFGSVYTRAHGISGIDVTYNVLYEEGAPPTPTTGATTTPPVPITPTPCPQNQIC